MRILLKLFIFTIGVLDLEIIERFPRAHDFRFFTRMDEKLQFRLFEFKAQQRKFNVINKIKVGFLFPKLVLLQIQEWYNSHIPSLDNTAVKY
jgi:hypothetical protein